ncbi:hypothetical protein TNCV_579021 [Trichonephila clavipes]|nr:hypothetical protein TNCV_579021 [Trichonephila clavipes]
MTNTVGFLSINAFRITFFTHDLGLPRCRFPPCIWEWTTLRITTRVFAPALQKKLRGPPWTYPAASRPPRDPFPPLAGCNEMLKRGAGRA